MESAAPRWGESEGWTVEPEPSLVIGLEQGAEPYLFSSIVGGVLLPDDGVVLLDRQTKEIRVFDASGAHRVTFGGRGGGPAEFGANTSFRPSVAFRAPDTLVAWDNHRRRLLRFGLDGSLRSELDLAAAHPDSLVPLDNDWRVLSDGSLLYPRLVSERSGETVEYGLSVRVIPGDGGSVQRVVDLPLYRARWVPVEDGPSSAGVSVGGNFNPQTPVATREGPLRILVADSTRWEVRAYTPQGRVESVFRAALARDPLTPALRDTARAATESRFAGSAMRSALLDAYAALPQPDSLPAIGQAMYWDEAGYLWVSHYEVRFGGWRFPRRFEVFDSEGVWLGGVRIPDDIEVILEIRGGRILAVRIDDLGVNRAVVYRVVEGRQ